jgi:F0F1-type ATP synthase delta subunit
MTGELNSLLRDILQYRAERGHIEATAVSAYGLSEQVINDIEQILRSEYPKAKSITIDKEYDPELVGGLKLKLANQQLDLSVQSKLNKFKRLTALERNKQ